MKHFLPTERMQRLATGRNVLLFFGLFFAFQSGILPVLQRSIQQLSGGPGVLDLLPFYSIEEARSRLAAYGPEGIKTYIAAEWTADLVFPATVGLAYSTLLFWLGERRWWRLPFVITLVDWAENVFITVLLVRWPGFDAWAAVAACLFTSLKWALIGATTLLALWRGGQRLWAWGHPRFYLF